MRECVLSNFNLFNLTMKDHNLIFKNKSMLFYNKHFRYLDSFKLTK